jgi:hypothetical protein
MSIQTIRDYAYQSIDIIDHHLAINSSLIDDGKFTYVKEIEVIRGLLQNLIFWCDISLEKNINENKTISSNE